MLKAIKQAAIDAVEQTNPVIIQFGTVISTSPLEVSVDQRFTLSEDFLIIPERLLYLRGVEEEFELEIQGVVQTGPANDDRWTGDMKIWGQELKTIRRVNMPLRPLEVGDELILLRMQGGQQYLVIDRVWKG